MVDKKIQQEKLHPLVNGVHLAATTMADMGIEIQAGLIMSVEDLPEDLQDLPWVKKVQKAYSNLKKGVDQTAVLYSLFEEGKNNSVLPEGYLI